LLFSAYIVSSNLYGTESFKSILVYEGIKRLQ